MRFLRSALCMTLLCGVIVSWTGTSCALAQKAGRIPAFPGAEGYGRFALGGRGGDVYHVTNLKDKGPGSLRYGIESLHDDTERTDGGRTIVFDVSGTIKLKEELEIENISQLTIAGQTAPGDGITLRDHKLDIEYCSDLVIRYLRVRLGDVSKTETEPLQISHAYNVILDHITATWGIDSTMDTDYMGDFTLQWSIYGWCLHQATHHKGGHAMLMSLRKATGDTSVHHNLFFSSRNRHPTLGSSPPESDPDAIIDFRNNVVYNREGHTNLACGQFNLINNYYRPGPNTDRDDYPIAPKVKMDNVTVGYMSGNVFEANSKWTRDNYSAMEWGVRDPDSYPGEVTPEKFCLPKQPVAPADRPITHQAKEAYRLVLAHSGASLSRDSTDKRVVKGIRNRQNHRIDSQEEVGGWPELKSKPAPKDTDQDGMPDEWETKMELNPNDPNDRNGDLDGDGYTNLEEYLNSLVVDPTSLRR